jgi:exodeoxyribonuclease VII large subunit
VARWYDANVQEPARRLLDFSYDVLNEATAYVGERRRTMIFAVRDRLRAEERHLGATRDRLVVQSRQLLTAASMMIQSNRQLLVAYDPARRLAQGWSVVTTAEGTVVKSLEDVATGDEVRVRVADGTFGARVGEKEESTI